MLEKVTQATEMHSLARLSTFWELEAEEVMDPAFEKEAWLNSALLNFGDCGFTVGDEATLLYCSRDLSPGVIKMPTSPVSEDADIITSLFINPARAGRGLEAVLLDAAIMNLTQRGSSAVEAFGFYTGMHAPNSATPDPVALDIARHFLGTKPAYIGLMTVDVLQAAGFEVVADHPVIPRLRLELPPAHDLLTASAIEQLLAQALA